MLTRDDVPDGRDEPPSAEATVEVEGQVDPDRYLLRLFVTGMTPRSTQAIARIKAICEENLRGRYELEVVDIYQHPEAARREQIVATPTLVKRLPPPLRRLVGDLSDKQRVLVGLDIKPPELH